MRLRGRRAGAAACPANDCGAACGPAFFVADARSDRDGRRDYFAQADVKKLSFGLASCEIE